MNYPTVANVLCGVAWSVAYYAMAYRGLRDKSFGMPLIPLALNCAWEFFRANVFRDGTSGVEAVSAFVWLTMDVCIAATFVIYGYRNYKAAFGVSGVVFYGATAFTFVSAFLIMGTGIPFFRGLAPYFDSSLTQSLYFIALLQNLVMSAAFIGILWLRRTSEGQSLWIALSKIAS